MILTTKSAYDTIKTVDTEHAQHTQKPHGTERAQKMFYGYCRVSTETQSEKGYGLEAQREAIEKYAAAQGLTLESIFTDAGISGNLADDAEDDAINKRQGLIEMLAALQEGDTVIILNTSRLWRSDMTKAIVKRELMRRKAFIHSIEQPDFDLYRVSKDPSAYLTNAIMEALDVYERMSISLKLARGRTVKAKTGAKPAGVCPYGYQYAADKKSVEVNEPEAQLVRFMFTEGQKGRSLGQIADALNAKQILTRQGKSWSRGSIQAILRNEFYTGTLYHAGQPIKGTHTPIISKVQFGKVAAQLDKRHR